jgi:NADH:ubiquinone oxidoreductase subunit E
VKILEQIQRELGIHEGETTADKKFSVESVRCLGCCGLAPVVTIGNNLHGKVPLAKVSKILKQY